MDKKRFLSLASAAACFAVFGSVAPVQVNAQAPDPYANTLEAADFGSFDRTSSFSIQADMSSGQVFSWQGSNGYSFSYTAPKLAVYSFLVDFDNQKVTVYESSAEVAVLDLAPISYVDSVNISPSAPNLILQQIAGSGEGIYSSSNLFQNPGFEEYATFTKGDESTIEVSDTQGTPADWNYTNTQWRSWNIGANSNGQSVCGSDYNGLLTLMEGNIALMMHNTVDVLSQQINVTPGQWYKVNWRQLSHKDTSPVTAYHAYILKDSAVVATDRANVIAQHDYYSAPEGIGFYVDPLFAFRIPEGTTGTFYFGITKGTNTINHFDMMTLMAIDESYLNMSPKVTFAGESVTWEEGLSVPQGGGEVIYEDVTSQYMVNPSFEENVDQQHNISPYNPDATVETADGSNNGGINEPYGWTVAYSTGIKAGDVWDQANVNNGTRPADVNLGNSPLPVQPTDGEWFYYYRSRWYNDQDFTVSQTTAELPVGYYNITFDAAVPEGNTPVTVTVGDYITEMSNSSMETYTFRVNIAVPQTLVISFASFKDGDAGGTAATLAIDNFRIYYCGEADEEAARASLVDQMASYYTRLAEYDPSMVGHIVPAGVEAAWYAADDAYWDISDPESATLEELQNCVTLQRNAYNVMAEGVDVLAELQETVAAAEKLIAANLPGLSDYQTVYDVAKEAAEATSASSTDYVEITNAYCDSIANLLITSSRAYVLSGVTTATDDEPYNIVANDYFQQVVSAPQFTTVGGDTSDAADLTQGTWATNNVANGGDFRTGNNHVTGTDTIHVNCYNNWSNSFTSLELYQEITNLPEGLYTITAKESDNQTLWYDQHLFVSSVAGEAVGAVPTTDISQRIFGEYTEMPETEKIWVPEGGTLRIGMKSTSGGDVLGWFCATDFELFYYPAAEGEGSNAVANRAEEVRALAEAHASETLGAEKDYISAILTQADAISSSSSNEEITAALNALNAAEDTINVCVTESAEFQTALETAQTLIADPSYNGGDATTFQGVIDEVINELTAAGQAGSGKDITYLDELADMLSEGGDAFVKSYAIAQVVALENSDALNGVSEGTPVDLTDFIVNPTIENESNTANPEGWTFVKNTQNDNYTNNGEHYSGDAANTYLDNWNGSAGALASRISQTIYVPNGQYILRCAARADGVGAYIYANGDTVQIKNDGNTGGAIWEAAEEGSETKLVNDGQGYGWSNYEVRFGVYDNALTLGVTTVCGYEDATKWTGTWFSVDDFQLLMIEKGWSVGIEEVGADAAADFKVYVNNGYITVEGAEDYTVYSISGMQVDATQQLPAGTYIVSANGKAVKVAVK
ncbi:MAG: hypothetical protein ACOYJE_00340 [Bacteroidaceae bacterium]|jgi:hypothetical protein